MTVALSASQAALLFVTASLVLVLWYFLRRRARRREVPSLAYFKVALERRARPFWRELLALLLQIVAAGLLAAALVAPASAPANGPTDRPVMVVVDGSRSMSTPGRLEAARALAFDLDAGIILAGDGPEVLAPPRPTRAERERAIARITATAARADLERAVRLARSLGADPIVLSDAAHDELDVPTRIVGPAADDAGIDELSVSAGPGLPARVLIAATVTAHGAATKRRLVLRTDAGTVGELDLDLAAGETARRVVSIRPVPGQWLEATLEGADDYPDDDRAFSLFPTIPPARVALVGPPNRYLDEALKVLPDLEVRRYAPGREPALDADLAIFDRATPRAPLALPSLHFDPPRGWTTGTSVKEPRVLRWSLDHPVFQGVALRALQIQEADILAIPPGGAVLASTAEGPILVADLRAPGAVVFGFDILRSDLPLSVAFPELLYQALVWARSTQLPPVAASVLEGASVPLGADVPTIVERLDVPDASVARGEVRLHTGVYRLTEPSGTRMLAVSPDPREHGSPFGGEAPPATDTSDEGPARTVRPLAVLAAGLVLFAEFFVAPL